MRRLLVLLLPLLAAACATRLPDPAYAGAVDAALGRLLAAEPSAAPSTITQRISVEAHHRHLDLTAVVERDGSKRSVVLVNDLGLTVLAVASDKGRITHEFRSPVLPLKMRPQWILFDWRLAHGNRRELQKSLTRPWRLSQSDHQRELFYKGRLVKRISWRSPGHDSNAAPSEEIVLTDLVLGYRLTVIPVPSPGPGLRQ